MSLLELTSAPTADLISYLVLHFMLHSHFKTHSFFPSALQTLTFPHYLPPPLSLPLLLSPYLSPKLLGLFLLMSFPSSGMVVPRVCISQFYLDSNHNLLQVTFHYSLSVLLYSLKNCSFEFQSLYSCLPVIRLCVL